MARLDWGRVGRAALAGGLVGGALAQERVETMAAASRGRAKEGCWERSAAR